MYTWTNTQVCAGDTILTLTQTGHTSCNILTADTVEHVITIQID